jgi:hypothetical protein
VRRELAGTDVKLFERIAPRRCGVGTDGVITQDDHAGKTGGRQTPPVVADAEEHRFRRGAVQCH